MAETEKKMGRPKGSKDRKPRRTEGYKESSPKNLEKAREHSPIMQGQKKEMPEGCNAKMVSFIIAINPTEPLDPNDVDEMERRFVRYLELCAEWDMKVGNQAAYVAIGISKDDVYNWTVRSSTNPRRREFVKKVQKICGMYREGLMQDGKINPVTGIFWQKNYDGMKDQQEVVLTPNNPLGDTQDAEALKQKYLESADVVEIAESNFSEAAESAERLEVDCKK